MGKLIGLTGKTGAGKSTVSEVLKSHGAVIIDGDKIARDILNEKPELLDELKACFGEDIVRGGVLDRKALARKAFSDTESTNKLNSIMHPAINRAIDEKVSAAFAQGAEAVIVDAAAIIESGFTEKCDYLLVVTAPKPIRLCRIMERDGISEADALVRINAQKDDEFYDSRADYIIVNDGSASRETLLNPVIKEIFPRE